MAYGKLGPRLTTYARTLGAEAASAVRLGQVPPPCPWSTDDASLTKRRMAGVWLDAFTAGVPGLKDA